MTALLLAFLLTATASPTKDDLNWHMSLPVAPATLKAVPFDLQNVRLTSGSFWYQAQDLNRQYLLNLNSDSMLWNFRTTAGLAAPGTPYPGWEAPDCELRGHFVGHWLSASALMWASTGDANLKTKMTSLVTELGTCQTKMGTGYLSAFPTEEFDRLEAHQSVWAPYYTIHKIMAGLLDQYTIANNTQALTIVTAMANYFYGRIQNVLKTQGMSGWQSILNEEWGGMNDVMYSIYAITNNANHLDMANLFDHYTWTRPLAAGQDDLNGNHANTHIPEVIGNARAWEVVSNATQQNITNFFYTTVTQHHSWVTGGSNDNEYWGAADRLGDQLNLYTEESCTQYNIQKVARHIFGWTADARLMDFYERAMLNGIVGNEKASGVFIYMMPIGQPGQTKGDNSASGNVHWGTPYGDFWCCYGTMIESFSKLGDSVYFFTPDNSAIYVNQFVPSTLTWSTKGVTLVQKTDFPTTSATTLSISQAPGSSWTLNLRIPSWAVKPTLTVNGVSWTGTITPGSYVAITRSWAVGDVVEATFPMTFAAERIQDTRSQYVPINAFLYGPLLLAGLTSNPTLTGSTTDLSWFTRTSTTALNFTAHDQAGDTVNFLPLLQVISQKYTIYFNTSSGPVVHYNAAGSLVDTTDAFDYLCSGGAAVVSNPTLSLRSGNPGETNTVDLTTAIQDDTHNVDGLTLQYSYVTGYGTGTGTNFTISLVGSTSTTVYTSPQLTDYSYDSCNTCYSPPVSVSKLGLNLSAKNSLKIRFTFQDNQKNVQLKLNLNATIHWVN